MAKKQPFVRKLRTLLDAAERHIEEGSGIEHDEFWSRVESDHRAREEKERSKHRRTKPCR